MATISSFEELEVWQNGRKLSAAIYKLTKVGTFASDYKLKHQINDSTASIMRNIAEGFERDGTREFSQFLSISKGSAGEARSDLYVALDRGHIELAQFTSLKEKVLIISKQLSSLMAYLKRTGFKGTKFPEKT
jgi:four helix bundle protein